MKEEILFVWMWIYVAIACAFLVGLYVDYYYTSKRIKILKRIEMIENMFTLIALHTSLTPTTIGVDFDGKNHTAYINVVELDNGVSVTGVNGESEKIVLDKCYEKLYKIVKEIHDL
jgi:hypothetical protein